MKNKIIRSVAFITGLIGILVVISAFIKPDKDVYNAVLYQRKLEDIKSEKENTIDVFFAGDSEVYSAFLPVRMFEKYGYTSYACSFSAQRLCDTYAMLQETYKTQSPKLLVLETNSFYRYSASDKEKKDIVMNKAGKLLPVIKYHSRWKYAAGKLFNDKSGTETAWMKGSVIRKKQKPYEGGEYMIPCTDVEKPDNLAKDYLEKIISLCKDNNTEVVFVTVAAPDVWSYARYNGMKELAEELNITYIDTNFSVDDIGIDWKTDTLDRGNHLNLNGAVKFSDYIGKYISDNYELPDHRDDKNYADWYKHSDIINI